MTLPRIEEYYYRAKLIDGSWVELVSYTAQNDRDLIQELNNPLLTFIKERNSCNHIVNKNHFVSIETHHVKYASDRGTL